MKLGHFLAMEALEVALIYTDENFSQLGKFTIYSMHDGFSMCYGVFYCVFCFFYTVVNLKFSIFCMFSSPDRKIGQTLNMFC